MKSGRLTDKSMVADIREASRRFVRELGLLEEKSCCAGIGNSQAHALMEIDSRGALGVAELATLLNIDRSTASRLCTQLIRKKLVRAASSGTDLRRKGLILLPKGRRLLAKIHGEADAQVTAALERMRKDEVESLLTSVRSYAAALSSARASTEVHLRKIKPADNAQLAALIRSVFRAYGACGPGFASHDPTMDRLSQAFRGTDSLYLVAVKGAKILGGAGIGPLQGGPPGTCELKRMALLPEARGLGVGTRLLNELLSFARSAGFKQVYLETLNSMHEANRLYERFGFRDVSQPMGKTGHFGCDRWRVLSLAKKRKR